MIKHRHSAIINASDENHLQTLDVGTSNNHKNTTTSQQNVVI